MWNCQASPLCAQVILTALLVLAPGCGGGDTSVSEDAGAEPDVGDGRSDLGVELDGGRAPDLGDRLDASLLDMGNATDAGTDSALALDAGSDAGSDAGLAADTGPVDAGFPTAIACPLWTGLPSGGVTLPSSSPEGVRVGPDCALYVSLDDTVYRIEEGTGVVTVFATGTQVTGYQGLDFGPDGNLYVAARSGGDAILRFDGTTGAFIDVFADTGIDGPNTPRFGPDGRLYVSCRNTANVVRFDPDGTLLGEFAADATLGSPEGISFGPDGHLYVAARTNSVLMRFNGVTGALMNQITATPAFMAPEGIGFTSDGGLWVASRDTEEVFHFDGLTFVELERFSLPTGERPIGLEIVADQVVVGLRGTGRVTVLP